MKRKNDRQQSLAYQQKKVTEVLLDCNTSFNIKVREFLPMQLFFHILANNILPIFVLILLGFWLGRKFPLDLPTLSKVYFYVFLPAFLFVHLVNTTIAWEMVNVFAFAVIFLALNMVISYLIGRIRKFSSSKKGAFANSIMFYNSGNVGLPLITLVFSQTPYFEAALTAQIIVLVFQNVTTNAVGIVNAARADLKWKELAVEILAMPSIWIIPLALIVKTLNIDLSNAAPLWTPLQYAADALVPTALLTLGVQLSRTKFVLGDLDVYLSVFVRLIAGPILAWIVLRLLQIQGPVGQALLISSSVPTAVNTALIALEFNNEPDFASQVVLTSTVCSACTLVVVIYSAQILFPL
jgi:predicted permease